MLKTLASLVLVTVATAVLFRGDQRHIQPSQEYIISLAPHVNPEHDFIALHTSEMISRGYLHDDISIGSWRAVTALLDERQLKHYLTMDQHIMSIEPVLPSEIFHSCHKRKSNNWGLQRLNVRDTPKKYKEAYRYSNTGLNVDTYVLDTGININHPEFEGRAIWGSNFWDNYNYDCNGHGTHVSGIIGSKSYGVAKEVTLIAVKTHSCNGEGTTKTLIKGLQWALQSQQNRSRPSVINISGGSQYSESLNRAVEECAAAGMIVVAAAGNSETDACKGSPGSSPAVITVSSSTKDDTFEFGTNYGSCVDFIAPGYLITSTWKNNGTEIDSGTSMACPHVSGVAAVYWSMRPNATMTEIETMMNETATVGKIKGAEQKGTLNKIPFVNCPEL